MRSLSMRLDADATGDQYGELIMEPMLTDAEGRMKKSIQLPVGRATIFCILDKATGKLQIIKRERTTSQ